MNQLFTQNISFLKNCKNKSNLIHSSVKVNHPHLQKVIDYYVRKFINVGSQNGLTVEDLNMYAIEVLLEYMALKGKEDNNFEAKEVNYYGVMLSRKMRDYANSDIRSQRKREDGKRENVYIAIQMGNNSIEYESGTVEDIVEHCTPENNFFSLNKYRYENSPYYQFLTENREEILTNSQNKVFDALISNNMNIQETANQLGKQRSSVERTLKSIGSRLNNEYNKRFDNYTRYYTKLLKEKEMIDLLVSSIEGLIDNEKIDKIDEFAKENMEAPFVEKILYDKLKLDYNGYFYLYEDGINFLNELISHKEFIENYPFKYQSDLQEPVSTTSQESKERVLKYKEFIQPSQITVTDLEGNFIRTEFPEEKKGNHSYLKINAYGVEINPNIA